MLNSISYKSLSFDKVSLSLKRDVLPKNSQAARTKAISPVMMTCLKVFLPYYWQPRESLGKFLGDLPHKSNVKFADFKSPMQIFNLKYSVHKFLEIFSPKFVFLSSWVSYLPTPLQCAEQTYKSFKTKPDLNHWHSEKGNNNRAGCRIWAFLSTTFSIQEINLLNISTNAVNLILVLKKILNEAVFRCGSGNKKNSCFEVLRTKANFSNHMT